MSFFPIIYYSVFLIFFSGINLLLNGTERERLVSYDSYWLNLYLHNHYLRDLKALFKSKYLHNQGYVTLNRKFKRKSFLIDVLLINQCSLQDSLKNDFNECGNSEIKSQILTIFFWQIEFSDKIFALNLHNQLINKEQL